jgi:hypothetical protein
MPYIPGKAQPAPLELPKPTAAPALPRPKPAPPSSERRDDCGTIEHPECSLFWLPALSLVLPGFGQAWDGRTWWPYSLAGAGGIGALTYATRLDPQLDPVKIPGDSRPAQLWAIGNAFFTAAGGLSVYETYRYRTQERMHFKGAKFRPVKDLLLAPVHFESALHWPVIAELLVAGALSGLRIAGDGHAFAGYLPRDAGTTAVVSLGAGIGEEPLFRGWMMSYLEHRWDWNPWLANGTQAVLFGLAHGGIDLRILFGFWDGLMAQHNDYDLVDNVFTHTWWDIMTITAQYATSRHPKAALITSPVFAF